MKEDRNKKNKLAYNCKNKSGRGKGEKKHSKTRVDRQTDIWLCCISATVQENVIGFVTSRNEVAYCKEGKINVNL
jgi:hypothetical protein